MDDPAGMLRSPFTLILALLLAPAPEADAQHGHDDATVHHRFEDAEAWARRFEDPERDQWQLPDSVLARIVDRPDLVVADIGSATGYFAVRFARAVPQGFVIGADVEPSMTHYLNDRARREGIPNLAAVLAGPDDPHLPRAADVVFLCNTIHHIDARVDYFTRLRQQVRPGARLVVVDWHPDSEMGPPHKLEPARVLRELREAGWSLDQDIVGVLPEQYFLVFRSEG
jgi:SAM-dependent methyltransferase